MSKSQYIHNVNGLIKFAFNAYRRKKMKIKKLTALAMTTAMCAATIFGCGGSNDGNKETTTAGSGSNPTTNGGSSEPTKVSLKVWSTQEDQDKGWIQKMFHSHMRHVVKIRQLRWLRLTQQRQLMFTCSLMTS